MHKDQKQWETPSLDLWGKFKSISDLAFELFYRRRAYAWGFFKLKSPGFTCSDIKFSSKKEQISVFPNTVSWKCMLIITVYEVQSAGSCNRRQKLYLI